MKSKHLDYGLALTIFLAEFTTNVLEESYGHIVQRRGQYKLQALTTGETLCKAFNAWIAPEKPISVRGFGHLMVGRVVKLNQHMFRLYVCALNKKGFALLDKENEETK